MKDFDLLNQPCGMLWLCFLFGLDSAKMDNDISWGPFFFHSASAKPSTLFGERISELPMKWMSDLDGCIERLGVTRRNCGHLQMMHHLLCTGVGGGSETMADKEALALTSKLLDHETTKSTLLIDRIRTQHASLGSLIGRADTKTSMDYIKSGRELTEATLAIAEAAKHDSGAMRTIAYMTMLFLPGTFFAALFSMPVLRWDRPKVIGGEFWIYLGLSIPVSLLIMLASTIWTRRRLKHKPIKAVQPMKDDEQVFKEQIVDVMHDLDLRLVKEKNQHWRWENRELWWARTSESC